jgi:hypothetical protein
MSDAFLATRNWPSSADQRRLDAAFVNLNAQGIMAIHNGPCCDTCVGAYIWGEAVPAARRAGQMLRGYVFYNEQTSASVAGGGELFLVCGTIPRSEGKEFRAAAKKVTSLVKAELIAQGLSPKHTRTEYVLRVPIRLDDGAPLAEPGQKRDQW